MSGIPAIGLNISDTECQFLGMTQLLTFLGCLQLMACVFLTRFQQSLHDLPTHTIEDLFTTQQLLFCLAMHLLCTVKAKFTRSLLVKFQHLQTSSSTLPYLVESEGCCRPYQTLTTSYWQQLLSIQQKVECAQPWSRPAFLSLAILQKSGQVW